MNRELYNRTVPCKTEDERQSAELHGANDVFPDLLSHDLRGSMNVILNYSELLMAKNRSLTQLQQEDYIREVYLTALQTSNLLDNLLLWTQLKSRKITASPEVFQALDVINDLLFLIKTESKSGDVLFFDEFVADEWVKADIGMFSKIVKILIYNALQQSPDHGKVFIRMYKHDDVLSVEVEDQGPSLPEDLLNGTAGVESLMMRRSVMINQVAMLGLVVSRDLAELNDGRLVVSAQPGRYNRIGFTVPLASEIEIARVYEEIKRETC